MEWMFPLWARFWVQHSLLLWYKIPQKLVTHICTKIVKILGTEIDYDNLRITYCNWTLWFSSIFFYWLTRVREYTLPKIIKLQVTTNVVNCGRISTTFLSQRSQQTDYRFSWVTSYCLEHSNILVKQPSLVIRLNILFELLCCWNIYWPITFSH